MLLDSLNRADDNVDFSTCARELIDNGYSTSPVSRKLLKAC